MGRYVVRRLIYMLVVLWVISVVAFAIIQLPPGDYLSSYIARLEQTGTVVSQAEIAALRKQYGLDAPIHVRYLKWIWRAMHGDFGRSFEWNKPVSELLGQRLWLTVTVSILALLVTYAVAIPTGIYSATHQYSLGDWFFTTLGFIGLATPGFFLALLVMFVFQRFLHMNVGGLFSARYMSASWSLDKLFDMVKHLPVPIIVVAMAGTASLIRVMRACLLDELRKQYVITARAKGVSEKRLLFKYPVRIALNPIVSTVGWLLPQIVSGATIVSVVLNLPTTGPVLLLALLTEDIYLSSSIVMLLSYLTILGTFISDLLLLKLDPRIRLQ